MELYALVHKEADGYWAEVLAFPGCVTEGDTSDELYDNLQEAVTGWIEADILRGSPVVGPYLSDAYL